MAAVMLAMPRPYVVMRGGGAPFAAVTARSASPIARPKSVSGNKAATRGRPCAALRRSSRSTCSAGVMPSVQTPGRATEASLVKASTGMRADVVMGAAAAVSAAVSGPMMIWSPAAIAARAALAAPSGVPPVSCTSSAGEPGAERARVAALRSAAPISARGPVIGASSATLPPVPGGPPGPDGTAPSAVGPAR